MNDDNHAISVHSADPKNTYLGNVILHLSDLHFGYDTDTTAEAQRKTALNNLVSTVDNQEACWKPTIVCVTGDIAMRALSSDYSKARKWLLNLLSRLKLEPRSLVICPGNHDVERNVAFAQALPPNAEKADYMLGYGYFQGHKAPFCEFQKFCSSLSVPKYSVGRKKSYLTGIRKINNIRFVCLNSAWFSQRNKIGDKYVDDGRLWLGLPLLEYFESKGAFPCFERKTLSVFTIVLFHHPFESLHDNERNQRNPRKNTKEFIANRSHLIFTGHDHGVPADPTPLFGRAHHFRGGATYENSSYQNSFHLIRLEDTYLLEKRFIYQAGSHASAWQELPAPDKVYYWDYEKRAIEEAKEKEAIAKIENNIDVFERKMLDSDYTDALRILESGRELMVGAKVFLPSEKKLRCQVRYSDSIINNLPRMSSEQKAKYTETIQRILNI